MVCAQVKLTYAAEVVDQDMELVFVCSLGLLSRIKGFLWVLGVSSWTSLPSGKVSVLVALLWSQVEGVDRLYQAIKLLA